MFFCFRCLILVLGSFCKLESKREHQFLTSSTASAECPRGHLEIPNNVTVIEKEQFSQCQTLRVVTLSDSVQVIKDMAFFSCKNLQRVNFGKALESIEMKAFCSCNSLTSIMLPKSVKHVGVGAFAECSSLHRIRVDTDNEFFVEKSGALIGVNQGSAVFLQCPAGKEGDFRVPQFVSSIEAWAFYGCRLITSIHIPEGINRIEENTFWGCHKLETVNVPDNLEFVGMYAFDSCLALKSVSFGLVRDIPEYVCQRCSAVKTLAIPESCTSIGYCAFCEMTSLVSVDFQNCPAAIGTLAFSFCSALADIFNMSSLTDIGREAFAICHSLKSAVIGDQCESIGLKAFVECLVLSNVSIGKSVTSIGFAAFAYCRELTYLYIPKSVSFIAPYAFASCLMLEIDVDPDNSNYISDDGVFISVSNSRMVRFPASRTGHYEIPGSVETLGDSAFAGSQLSSLSIPASVSVIEGTCFLTCMNLETITIEEGNEHFKLIDGVIFSSDESCLVFFPSNRYGSYVVPSTVSELPEGVFALCQLESITLPDSVTSVPSYAFYRSPLLKNITLGNNVETIGDWVFRECFSLVSIVIPDSVVSIRDSPFYGCELLESVVLGKSLRTISIDMFRWCYSLSSVNIPDSVELIENYAFGSCYSLTSIVLGSGVSYIGSYAFAGSGLAYVFLPANIQKIDNYAFQLCENLTVINFTGTEEPEIGFYLLQECYNIRDIFVPANYDGDTLFGLPVTKANVNESTKQNMQIRRSIIFVLVYVLVFGVIDIIIDLIKSVKCRMKLKFESREYCSEQSQMDRILTSDISTEF